MTVQEIFTYVRNRTKTNTTSATDGALFSYLNERHRQSWSVLQNAREDYGGEISTTDLVAGQQEYPFPDEAMKVKRLEAMFDGVTWTKVKIFDINERLGATDSTTVDQDFNSAAPYADVHDSSLFLFPIPETGVVNGLKLWHFRRPGNLDSVGATPELPKEHHMFLVDLISLDVEVSRGRMTLTQALEAAEQILNVFEARVSPRVMGQNVRMQSRRKNYR